MQLRLQDLDGAQLTLQSELQRSDPGLCIQVHRGGGTALHVEGGYCRIGGRVALGTHVRRALHGGVVHLPRRLGLLLNQPMLGLMALNMCRILIDHRAADVHRLSMGVHWRTAAAIMHIYLSDARLSGGLVEAYTVIIILSNTIIAVTSGMIVSSSASTTPLIDLSQEQLIDFSIVSQDTVVLQTITSAMGCSMVSRDYCCAARQEGL